MASPSTVITLGYGTFGSVNLLPTLGFGASVFVYGPLRIAACDVFIPFNDADVLIPLMPSDVFVPRPEVDVELP